MNRIPALWFVFILAFFTSAGQSARAQDPDDVVRVNTTMVVLPVRVMDRHKQTVAGLKQDQFRIFEDGVEQQIVYFEAPSNTSNTLDRATDQPLTIALMLDVSDSTELKLQQIRSTAQAFVDLLRPHDRVIVIAFDKGFQILSQVGSSRAQVHAAINSLQPGGGTSLYTALSATIT